MYESDCLLHMSRNGISFQGPFLCDGKIHRFSIDAKKNQPDEWYVAYSASMPTGQPYFCCIYGSWSDGSKFEYKSWEDSSNRAYYSPIDRKLLQAKIEENRRLAAIEQQKRHQESAEKAQEIWEHSSPIGSHPYLGKKKVQAYGVRFDTHSLLIPLRNIEGDVRSLQFIYQEGGKFEKRFLSGGEKQSHFHQIGKIREDSLICIAEGYATGANWHEATSHPTLIAFDSGNLLSVTQVMRSRYPSHQILIVGDDDIEAKVNVGRQKATQVAKAHHCLCIFPEFKSQRCDSQGKVFTDFNDLHVSHGLEEIRIQLEAFLTKQKTIRAHLTFKDLDSLIDQTDSFADLSGYILEALSANKDHLKNSELKRLNKKIARKAGVSIQDLEQDKDDEVNHRSIALSVIDAFGPKNLVESVGKIWKWNDAGLWEPVDDRLIKRKIHELMPARKITKFSVESVLDITKTEVFMTNHRFDVDTRAINCLNGELCFREGVWHLEPHDKQSYRTTQIPIFYDPKATAPRFEQFLDEVFEGDEDAEVKKVLVCELLGYSLLASCEFEKFVILLGNGANGKSVLLHVIEQLVGTSHVSAVQPSQFDNRFQRAHLFGKLVNIVTEIAEGAEIADATLKAIVSGERTTAEQKHKNPFDFHPFCTCWFGTNHMPHCRDFSDAIFRRAVILSFNRKFEGVNRDVNLRQKLNMEMAGILNLALEGISGVFNIGEFTHCPSSEAAKKHWRFECDQVEQFVVDACELTAGLRSPSQDIFKSYINWAREMGVRKTLGHNGLTQRLQKLGVETSRGTNGQRMLFGIAIKSISLSDASDA
jgi:putative DNA primase/helicase